MARFRLALAVVAAIAAQACAPASSLVSRSSPLPDAGVQGPELFGAGIFSTGHYDLPPTFSSDGRTALFTVSTPAYGRLHVIMETHLQDGRWNSPRVAPFSGQYGDADPIFSPDGSRLFFISRRPLEAGGEARRDFDVFYVEREGSAWGAPRHVAAASGSGSEFYASAAADGTLYIAAVRPDSRGAGDIYRVPFVDGAYREPENLGPAINSPDHHDTTPYIAPDQSFLIFGSSNRPGGSGSTDLYISVRREDGTWSPARNLGPLVNSASADYCPVVSSDGEYLYFASERGFADAPLERPVTTEEWEQRITSPGNGLGDTFRIPLRSVLGAAR